MHFTDLKNTVTNSQKFKKIIKKKKSIKCTPISYQMGLKPFLFVLCNVCKTICQNPHNI